MKNTTFDLKADYEIYAALNPKATLESYITDHNDSGLQKLSKKQIETLRSIIK